MKCRRQCYFSTEVWVFVRIKSSGFMTIYVETSKWTQVQMGNGVGGMLSDWSVIFILTF